MARDAGRLRVVNWAGKPLFTAVVLGDLYVRVEHGLLQRLTVAARNGRKGPWIGPPLQTERYKAVPECCALYIAVIDERAVNPSIRVPVVDHRDVDLHDT